MKLSLIALAVLAMLSGCGSLDGILANRVACTVGKDKAYVVSAYGAIGIASTIDDADRAIICK